MSLPPYLTEGDLEAIITRGLLEDVGSGDVTTLATVEPGVRAEATFLAKADGVLAGTVVVERVFRAVDPEVSVEWLAADADLVRPGQVFGRLYGPAAAMLTGERLALNFMQRMSGIATAARAMADAMLPHPARLLDTRKTVPGLRSLDKWAVLLGGATNHRVGLWDMILIKDNHIAAAGGVAEAIRAAQVWRATNDRRDLRIEIEVRTDDELAEVLRTGSVDVILLDNMVDRRADGSIDVSRLERAVREIGGRYPAEASGNVSLETVKTIAATGVAFISAGSLTHSVRALDISLEITLASGA